MYGVCGKKIEKDKSSRTVLQAVSRVEAVQWRIGRHDISGWGDEWFVIAHIYEKSSDVKG